VDTDAVLCLYETDYTALIGWLTKVCKEHKNMITGLPQWAIHIFNSH